MKTDQVVNKHHFYLICNKGAAKLNRKLGPGSSDFPTCNFDSGDEVMNSENLRSEV